MSTRPANAQDEHRIRHQIVTAESNEHVASTAGKALNLWRGTPLEDIPSPTLRWSAAEALHELRLELVTTRIDAELCRGQERHVVAELRQLGSEHPLREHIQAQLALTYYRCGRQVEALKVYQKVRGLADPVVRALEPNLGCRVAGGSADSLDMPLHSVT
jgi:hypothetical protein